MVIIMQYLHYYNLWVQYKGYLLTCIETSIRNACSQSRSGKLLQCFYNFIGSTRILLKKEKNMSHSPEGASETPGLMTLSNYESKFNTCCTFVLAKSN